MIPDIVLENDLQSYVDLDYEDVESDEQYDDDLGR